MTVNRKHPRIQSDINGVMSVGEMRFEGKVCDVSLEGVTFQISAVVRGETRIVVTDANSPAIMKVIKEKYRETTSPVMLSVDLKNRMWEMPFLVRNIYDPKNYGLEVYDGSNTALSADVNRKLLAAVDAGKNILNSLVNILIQKGNKEVGFREIPNNHELPMADTSFDIPEVTGRRQPEPSFDAPEITSRRQPEPSFDMPEVSHRGGQRKPSSEPLVLAETPEVVSRHQGVVSGIDDNSSETDIERFVNDAEFVNTLVAMAAHVIPEAFFGVFGGKRLLERDYERIGNVFMGALIDMEPEKNPAAVRKEVSRKISGRIIEFRKKDKTTPFQEIFRKAVYEALNNDDQNAFFPGEQIEMFDSLLAKKFAAGMETYEETESFDVFDYNLLTPAEQKDIDYWYSTTFIKIGKKNIFTVDLASSLIRYFLDRMDFGEDYKEMMTFIKSPKANGKAALEQLLQNSLVLPDSYRIENVQVRKVVEPLIKFALYVWKKKMGKAPLISDVFDIVNYGGSKSVAGRIGKPGKVLREVGDGFFEALCWAFMPEVINVIQPLLTDYMEDVNKAVAAKEWKEKLNKMDPEDIISEFFLQPLLRDAGFADKTHFEAGKSIMDRIRRYGRQIPANAIMITSESAQELSDFRKAKLDKRPGIGEQFDVIDVMEIWRNTTLPSTLDPVIREKIETLIICRPYSAFRTMYVLKIPEGQIIRYFQGLKADPQNINDFIMRIENSAVSSSKHYDKMEY